MFDEEEPIKKPKPFDLDDLSVEEIEKMISDHKSEISNLEALLKEKKDKLKLADAFFKKNEAGGVLISIENDLST